LCKILRITQDDLTDASGKAIRGRPLAEEVIMSWIILFFAGLFEVGWAVGLKYTEGFSRPLPTALTIAAMLISLGLLGVAMKELPLGTAYAIWTGVGAIGTVIAGIVLFGESMALFRLASVALILCGLVGLKLST
jgi:quaternary ammonium compound-resistance protein SugE